MIRIDAPEEMLQEYRNILGVSTINSLEEIKIAYRNRAKVLHPDLNSSPDAHGQFCLLNEAYDFYTLVFSKNQTPEEWNKIKNNWYRNRNQIAKRTKQYANMNYDQFIATDFYQTSDAVHSVFDALVGVITLMTIIGLPILAYSFSGGYALFFVLLLLGLTHKGWIAIINQQYHAIKNKETLHAVKQLTSNPLTYLAISIVFNIAVFLYTFSFTFITIPLLLALYFSAIALGFFISLFVKNKLKKTIFRWAIFPFFVSLFFLLNGLYSSAPKKEIYYFQHHIEKTGKTKAPTSLMVLENKKYARYPGIRFVFNDQNSSVSRYVIFTIEKGLFGFRVLKDLSFSWADPRKAIDFRKTK